MAETSKKIVLTFPKELVDKPIVYKLIKEHNLVFNILKASITPEEEGLLVLELTGESKDVDKGVDYLKKRGAKIEPLSKDIVVDWEKCTQCGVCVAQCPTDALYVKDRKVMSVDFDSSKCIACELCVSPCPVRCIEVKY
jgi:NAD-dependent dihydropyrimidine dehydrogenase PreA subunit